MVRVDGCVIVAVIGGGYAGVTAANRLRASLTSDEATRVHVVLYSDRPAFVERIRLHELIAGTRDTVEVPYNQMLLNDIERVVGHVDQIDAARSELTFSHSGETRVDPFDYVIYAVGSTAVGAAASAFSVADEASALAARGRLRHLGDGASVVVVGGGATGVETASEVAANHPNASVTLVSRGPILGALPDSSRRVISRGLTRLGVSVVEDDTVDVVDTSRVVLRSGTALPADLVLWAAALSVPDLARDSGLAVDANGRLEVDSTLRSISSGRIFGAGDAVHVLGPAGAHLRMSCAAAIPLGGHAANSVLAEIRGQVRPDLNVGYLLQCYSLGRKNGLIQFVNAADEPRALHLSGRLAAEIKESICTLVVTGPTREGVKPNSYWAPKGPRLAQASR